MSWQRSTINSTTALDFIGPNTFKFEPRHEITNNVVCATSKGSDQPAHMRSLLIAFPGRLNIL